MDAVFFGSDDFALPTLEALAGSGRHRLLGVVSQPDRPAGRGRHLSPTPVSAWARARGLPLICPSGVNGPEPRAQLARWGGDIGVVIAFGQKIGDEVLNAFPHGCINLHSSLLPRYRGAAPVARALIAGESQTGVTVFRLVQRLDAGPIVHQQAVPIGPAVTAGELTARLAGLGPEAVATALDLIQTGQARFTPQDDSLACPAPKLSKAEGVVDWNQPADRVANRIRGLYPWPGAHSQFVSRTGRTLEVILARAMPEACLSEEFRSAIRAALRSALRSVAENGHPPDPPAPGVVGDDLAVQSGQGAVHLLEIKPAGGRLMSFADFVNGHHVRPGDRFVHCPV